VQKWQLAPLPIEGVVALVNGWGDKPRQSSGENEEPYPVPDTVGLGGNAAIEAATAAELVEVANRIHSVFASSDASEFARLLEHLVEDVGLTLRFATAGEEVREIWTIGDPSRKILAAATLSLVHRLRDVPDVRRLGVCTADDCVDVFADASPAGRRRYCTVTCQNRIRARTYRASRRP